MATPAVGFVALLLATGATGPILGRPDVPIEGVREVLRRTIQQDRAVDRIEAGGKPILAARSVAELYEARRFDPVWSAGGRLLSRADRFLAALERASIHGLRTEDYHGRALAELLSSARERSGSEETRVERLARLDLLLTEAVLLYASHLTAGKTDPATLHPDWRVNRQQLAPVPFLEGALTSADPEAAFAALLPVDPAYGVLEQQLARLRRIARAGGWPVVPPGPSLRAGDTSPRLPALAARLAATGDLLAADAEEAGTVYGPELVVAVERFQRRHGLQPDGVVGPRTHDALTVPVERRIDQILVNLERWRWLPANLGNEYVEVNIAGFTLRAVEDGRTALESRVIVGKRYSRTPVFTEEMTYLEINPTWHVPWSIASGELLPSVQEDPSYLAREGFRVFAGTGPDAAEVDPASVHWPALTRESFPYVLRQSPGPGNSLGRIKFMFPNRYSVYLHDTPARALFERAVRTLSHGCIRVERPVDLAAHLLRDEPGWSRERIEQTIASGRQRTVLLPQPIPVHMLYWTAWVDDQGLLQLRDDVYERDELVLAALRSPPPRDVVSDPGRDSRP